MFRQVRRHDFFEDLKADGFPIHLQRREQVSGFALILDENGEEEMLRADIGVIKLCCLSLCALEGNLR